MFLTCLSNFVNAEIHKISTFSLLRRFQWMNGSRCKSLSGKEECKRLPKHAQIGLLNESAAPAGAEGRGDTLGPAYNSTGKVAEAKFPTSSSCRAVFIDSSKVRALVFIQPRSA